MDAKQARRMAQAARIGPKIDKYISHIETRIDMAAIKGETSIENPHIGSADRGFEFVLRGAELHAVKQHAVKQHFNRKGFEWVENRNKETNGVSCWLYW